MLIGDPKCKKVTQLRRSVDTINMLMSHPKAKGYTESTFCLYLLCIASLLISCLEDKT
jgi:hypothetical protein